MARPRIGSGNLFQDTAKSVFTRITLNRYNNMVKRVMRKGFYGLPFTKEDFRKRVLEKLGGYDGYVQCRYCSGFFTIAQVAFDHAIPLSRGGGVELDNIEMPCAPCNFRKGGMRPDEYLLLLEFLDSKIPLAKTEILNRLEIAVQLAAADVARKKRADASTRGLQKLRKSN